MFEAKAGDVFEKGTWRRANRDGVPIVNFCCPTCGAYGALTGPEANHTIAGDGSVHPSVHCDCGFHDMVKLVGYAN